MAHEEQDKRVVIAITDTIYQELFGRTRMQMIDESKSRWDMKMLLLVHRGDIDEIMRDYMTTEALQALSHAESSVAQAIRRFAGLGEYPTTIPVADYVRGYKLGANQKLWEWES
jgi:hypothetical protein